MGSLRTEEEILASWREDLVDLSVSVLLITYNHESYLAQAIECILKQETDFPIELIIGEDASDDKTLSIALDFHNRYPRIIKVSSSLKNAGMAQNFINIANQATCNYIALCEGDDFWTSENKLSSQVTKLESNPGASACFHGADDLDDCTGDVISMRWSPPFLADEYSINDLFEYGNFVPTASVIFRRKHLGELSTLLSDIPHPDFAILTKLLAAGPLLYIDESMSVYRRHPGGIHSSNWGTVSTFRSLKTRVNIVNNMELYRNKICQETIQKQFVKLEDLISRDQKKIQNLETELIALRKTYDRARQSTAFRLGTAINKLVRPNRWFQK